MTYSFKMPSLQTVVSHVLIVLFVTRASCSATVQQLQAAPLEVFTQLDLNGDSKIPAFVITRLDHGLSEYIDLLLSFFKRHKLTNKNSFTASDVLSSADPREQRVPVVVASAKETEDKHPVESRVHFAIQNRTRLVSPKRVTTLPTTVIAETYQTESTVTEYPTTTTTTAVSSEIGESSSESSSLNSYSKAMAEEPRVPLLVPVRTTVPYQVRKNYRLRDISSAYVPSDVYTIETSMKYRPRNVHSNSIFYQKALSFVKQYKNVLVQNRPQGPTYRPNTDTDSPQHVVSAYREIPPVVYASHDTPYVPQSSSKSNSYTRPATYGIRSPSPIPAPATEDSYEVGQMNSQDVLPIQGEDRQLIGYLPVITLPQKSKLYLPSAVPKLMSTAVKSMKGSKSTGPTKSAGGTTYTDGSKSRKSASSSAMSYNSNSSMLPKKSQSSLLSPSLRIRSKSQGSYNSRSSYRSMSSVMNGDPYAASASSSVFREPFIPLLRISIKPSHRGYE